MTTTLKLKACNRCGGDLIPEELLGDIDLVCLQCGHRTSAPYAPTSAYTIAMASPTQIRDRQRPKRLQRKAA
jgi:DNA-directed RNA polymerase subunit M/transcription elongation factor TFIIS